MLLNLSDNQKVLLESCPSFEKFLSNYSPANLLVIYSDVFSLTKSVSSIRLSLNDINIVYTKTLAVKYVEEWLKFLNTCSNINKPLTNTSAVAFIIFNNYKHLYLSDMKLIFEWLLRGDYGAFYNSIDAQRILTAFNQYNIQREQEIPKIKKRINNAVNRYIAPFVVEAKKNVLEKVNKECSSNEDKRKEFQRLFQIEKQHLQKTKEQYRLKYIETID